MSTTICKGLTKNGCPCKNRTKNKEGFCHKHKINQHVVICIDDNKPYDNKFYDNKPNPNNKIIIDLTIEDDKKEELFECCICYEKIVPSKEKLNCNHSVCVTCIKQLRDDRCPMCRCALSSKLITEEMKTQMKNRKKQDYHNRMNELNRQYLNDFESGPWNNTRSSTHSRYLHNNSGPSQNTRNATRRRYQQQIQQHINHYIIIDS
jgi:hypothetical protein